MSNNLKYNISFHSCEFINDYVYYSNLNFNGLYKYDLKTNKNTFIGFFPGEAKSTRHLHGAVKLIKGKLYFAPMSGNCIAVYDIENGSFDSYNIRDFCTTKYTKFYDILEFEGSVYFIPSRSESIVKMNCKTNELNIYNNWDKYINRNLDKKSPVIKNGSFIYNNELYLPCCRDNFIIVIDLSTFIVRRIKIENVKNGFCDAFFNTNNKEITLLVNGEASIVKYNLDSGKSKVFKYPLLNSNNIDFPYQKMINLNERIFIPAYQQEYSLVFDVNDCVFYKVNLENIYCVYEREWNAFHYNVYKHTDDDIWIMDTGDYKITRVNRELKTKEFFYLIDKEAPIRIYSEVGRITYKENDRMDLNDFIRMVERA